MRGEAGSEGGAGSEILPPRRQGPQEAGSEQQRQGRIAGTPYAPPIGSPALHACRTPHSPLCHPPVPLSAPLVPPLHCPPAVLSVSAPPPPRPPLHCPAHLQSCVHRNGRLQVIKLDERCDVPRSPHHLTGGVQGSDGWHEGVRRRRPLINNVTKSAPHDGTVPLSLTILMLCAIKGGTQCPPPLLTLICLNPG